MIKTRNPKFCLTLLLSLILGARIYGETEGLLNKLLAPGPLMLGHMNLEKTDCLKCHGAGKGLPDSKCLDCHKEIKPFVEKKTGFHGKATKACFECHADHKGRNLDSTLIDPKKFDHSLSGYKLEGKHAEIKCSECHKQKRLKKPIRPQDIQYLAKSSTCMSCHKEDDPHFFKEKFAKMDCDKCHGLNSWKKEITFDHSLDTKYKLKGKHAEIKCNDCHLVDKKKKTFQYQWPNLAQRDCITCHKDDFHRFNVNVVKSYKVGNLNKCASCHTENKWKEIHDFSHDEQTRYPIGGKHTDLKCAECHLPKDKRFKQAPLPKVGIYNWAHFDAKTCEVCHNSPHQKEFSKELLKKKCTDCHIDKSWYTIKDGAGFDHDKTRFSLTGDHKEIRCSDCHGPSGKQVFKFKSFDKDFCIDCHNNIHKKQFTTKFENQKCSECHSTEKFTERLRFDHKNTNYDLLGSHTKVKCEECHIPTQTKVLLRTPNTDRKQFSLGKNLLLGLFKFTLDKEKECIACHSDYHKGQLSNNCKSCHQEDKWTETTFKHNEDSKYPLLGKHNKVKCSKCHLPEPNQSVLFKKENRPLIKYKPLGQACLDCHKDPHKGSFGKQCQECHTERDWKVTKNFHKNFTLTGVHYALECSECHKDGRKLAGLSQQCISCHLKDDVHSGTLSNCKECHQQQFWDISAFRHSLSQFPLRGAHRTIDCFDCHKGGVYKGLNAQCYTCHKDAAMSASSFNHTTPINYIYSDCTECHLQQFSFSGARK
jgi:nitrate/TMAO reductase-like tetraheme cytochrome c subunit